MLTPYRRHLKSCPNTCIHDRKCRCPVWAHGVLKGKFVRRSLKTTNWETGVRLAREWEAEGEVKPAEGISVAEACDRFMEYQVGRNLRAASLAKYSLLTKELKTELRGSIEGVTRGDLEAYQASWKLCPESRSNKLEPAPNLFRNIAWSVGGLGTIRRKDWPGRFLCGKGQSLLLRRRSRKSFGRPKYMRIVLQAGVNK